MTQDDAFLHSILSNPEDDTPRLVYADWLEEHGQPDRAEFIRVQCEWARMAVYNDHRRQLLTRQNELLATRGPTWLTLDWPIASNPTIHAMTFDRGFVAELSLRGRTLGDAGVRAMVKCPRLAFVTALDLSGNDIGRPGIEALAESPFLSRLAFLDLRDNPVSDPSLLEPLAASSHLLALQELVLTLERAYSVTSPDFSGEVIETGTEFDAQRAERVRVLFWQHGKEITIRGHY
jgi:uncharacterized protein (TIGR02996 family)